jgi:hypothetical protein
MNQKPSARFFSRGAAHLPSLLALAAVAGCGGGGGTAAPATTLSCQTNCVSGTAASGKPIAGAAVTLVDSTGATRSATTGADGTYQVDSTGLVAPFLIKVTTGSGATFYSVSANANAMTVVNLTQLTDLLVRTWYGAQNIDPGTAFSAPAANPAPSPAVMPTLSAGVQRMFQLWLTARGVPSGFNLVSTPFVANGTGIDAVLDATTITAPSPAAAIVTIVGGTVSQSTSLAFSAGSVKATTTTTDSAAKTTSSNVTTTAVPVGSGSASALTALTAALDAIATTINTKGAALAASDLVPDVDPGLLNDGENATQWLNDTVASVAGSTIAFQVQGVASLDLTKGLAQLNLLITQTTNGQSATQADTFAFRLVNGNWLISGNGLPYKFQAQAEMIVNQGLIGGWNQCNGAAGGNGMAINVGVTALAGQFSSGSISGGGAIWPNNVTTTPTQCVTSSALAAGASSLANGLTFDNFYINTGPIATANLPPAGTPITASMLRAGGGGSVIPATLALNAWTSDPVTITAPTNSALSAIVFGASTPVNWTLPTTYAIQDVKLSALVFTGSQSSPSTLQCSAKQPALSNNATSGSVVIPATCGGLPVVSVNINLGVNGVNGERSQAIFSLQ